MSRKKVMSGRHLSSFISGGSRVASGGRSIGESSRSVLTLTPAAQFSAAFRLNQCLHSLTSAVITQNGPKQPCAPRGRVDKCDGGRYVSVLLNAPLEGGGGDPGGTEK